VSRSGGDLQDRDPLSRRRRGRSRLLRLYEV